MSQLHIMLKWNPQDKTIAICEGDVPHRGDFLRIQLYTDTPPPSDSLVPHTICVEVVRVTHRLYNSHPVSPGHRVHRPGHKGYVLVQVSPADEQARLYVSLLPSLSI